MPIEKLFSPAKCFNDVPTISLCFTISPFSLRRECGFLSFDANLRTEDLGENGSKYIICDSVSKKNKATH